MRIRKKKWVKPYLENENEYLIRDLSHKGHWLVDFPFSKLYLEIGMGMGDFIVESAIKNPNILYIGFEKDETCVAKAILKAKEARINNFYVILANADALLDYFTAKEVDLIYLHFSDPWPKKSHIKRRLTHRRFLSIYNEILKDNGYIIFKSDNQILFEFTLIEATNNYFKLDDITLNYHAIKKAEPLTGYEAKFISLNMPIYFAKFSKNTSA